MLLVIKLHVAAAETALATAGKALILPVLKKVSVSKTAFFLSFCQVSGLIAVIAEH